MSEIKSQQKKLVFTEELLKLLSSVLRSRTMYPEKHPIYRKNCKRFQKRFEEFCVHDEVWTIVLLGGEFVYEKIPMPKVSAVISTLYRTMSDRLIESFTFSMGITEDEIAQFVSLLLENRDFWAQTGDVAGALAEKGIRNISFKSVELSVNVEGVSTKTDYARRVYALAKDALRDFFLSLFDKDKRPSLVEVDNAAGMLLKAMGKNRYSVASRIHTRHDMHDLVAHSVNTGLIACLAATGMGIPAEHLHDLMLAGMLHDIGMMGSVPIVEDGVIRKERSDTIYLQHPIRGMGILRSIPGVPQMAQVAAFEHHMQWDGEGFPKPGGGGEMGLVSSIISIASAYDALLHGEQALSMEQLPAVLAGKGGKQFDPKVVAHFIDSIGVYPPGTYVKLTNDKIGLVVDAGKGDVFRPMVKIIAKPDGAKADEEMVVDLNERDSTTGAYLSSVLEPMEPKDLRGIIKNEA